MERNEALPSRKPRIEHYQQDDLFVYAADKERWIRAHLASGQRLEALAGLAHELEATVAGRYEVPPLVVARSDQVYYPVAEQRGGLIYVSSTRHLPLGGDAELFGAHEIEGRLYGFAAYPRREEEELVAYLRRSEPTVRTRTGIHVPLWSVPVASSELQLVESMQRDTEGELVRRLGSWVLSLSDLEVRETTNVILRDFVQAIRDHHVSAIGVLHEVEACVRRLKQVGHEGEVLEQLFDLAALRLNFNKGVTMAVRSHRVVYPAETIRGYTLGGARVFSGITPQFAMMGESLRPLVGLTFHDEANVVQVSLGDIERLQRQADLHK